MKSTGKGEFIRESFLNNKHVDLTHRLANKFAPTGSMFTAQ